MFFVSGIAVVSVEGDIDLPFIVYGLGTVLVLFVPDYVF